MPGAASGFCVYNDPAIAIAVAAGPGRRARRLRRRRRAPRRRRRAHFWDDPRVLTISIHESGRYLFPGTGFPEDVGGPGAEGFAVNIALPPARPTRLAARLRRGGAAAARGVPARGARLAARLRQPRARPARAPRSHRRRPAHVLRRCCTSGRTTTRAADGWRRRWWLRARRGRAAGLEPPDRRGRGRAGGPATETPRTGVRTSTRRPRRRRNG